MCLCKEKWLKFDLTKKVREEFRNDSQATAMLGSLSSDWKVKKKKLAADHLSHYGFLYVHVLEWEFTLTDCVYQVPSQGPSCWGSESLENFPGQLTFCVGNPVEESGKYLAIFILLSFVRQYAVTHVWFLPDCLPSSAVLLYLFHIGATNRKEDQMVPLLVAQLTSWKGYFALLTRGVFCMIFMTCKIFLQNRFVYSSQYSWFFQNDHNFIFSIILCRFPNFLNWSNIGQAAISCDLG